MDYKNLYKLYSDVKKSLFISVSLVCNQSNHFFFNMKKKKKIVCLSRVSPSCGLVVLGPTSRLRFFSLLEVRKFVEKIKFWLYYLKFGNVNFKNTYFTSDFSMHTHFFVFPFQKKFNVTIGN
jgi:hypothetical protein